MAKPAPAHEPGASLTTQRPNEPPETRPVPPSWATVAPLLQRWRRSTLPLGGAAREAGEGGG